MAEKNRSDLLNISKFKNLQHTVKAPFIWYRIQILSIHPFYSIKTERISRHDFGDTTNENRCIATKKQQLRTDYQSSENVW